MNVSISVSPKIHDTLAAMRAPGQGIAGVIQELINERELHAMKERRKK